jgi:hypothetical protein
MKAFFNILQTLINRKIKTYPDEPFLFLPINNNIDLTFYQEDSLISFFIYNFYYKEKKLLFEDYHYRIANAKFLTFNEFINNSFYSNEIKEKVFNIFNKAQKCYHGFSRLAYIYKFKKYKIVVKDDLSLNQLEPENRNTFILLDNKSKFFFSLNDLISIIETAIGHSPNFFAEPIWPENPYNKQKLKPSTLYNIYFKMKESGRLISCLFHFFFLENFQITNFVEKYEAYIRENSIKKFIFNSPYTSLYIPILKMLKNNKYTNLLHIDKEFPKDKLVEIFRPFLYYYYIYNFDIQGSSKIHSYKLILYQKLKKFYQFNKLFGRKNISLNTNCYFKQQITSKFNTKHIGFYDIPVKIIDTYDDNFVFFNTNARINTFIENRIFINNSFEFNYFSEESFNEHEDDYNSYVEDQLTMPNLSENSFMNYFFNTAYSNNTYPNISPNNSNREPINIFQYENNDVDNNDSDSIS